MPLTSMNSPVWATHLCPPEVKFKHSLYTRSMGAKNGYGIDRPMMIKDCFEVRKFVSCDYSHRLEEELSP